MQQSVRLQFLVCPSVRTVRVFVLYWSSFREKMVFEILERAELAEFQDQWYAAIMKQTFPRVIIT